MEEVILSERVALGLPTLAGLELYEALETARAIGFQSVMSLPGGPNTRHSLGEFPTFRFYELNEDGRCRLKGMLKRFKHIAVHQAWDDDWKSWIDCAAYLEAEIVTIHHKPKATVEDQAEFLRRIGDYAIGKGVRIGVENVGGDLKKFVSLIESVEHPSMGATLDVGHCAYFDDIKSISNLEERAKTLNDLMEKLVRELGGRLLHLHVHNVRLSDWRDHRSVPEGVIDFPRLVQTLKEIGYGGLFVIELEEPEMIEKARESGRYLSRLLNERR